MEIKEEYYDIITGYEPKYKCKIKFIQNILVKLFGYKMITEKKLCKMIEISKNDYFKNIKNNKKNLN